jgi:hypothetical protein
VEQNYWLSREGEETEMATLATSPEARLAHHELAIRYGAKASQAETDTLASWGIERVPADQYWVNGFRYTSAGDAIAEAKRYAAL